MPRRNAEQLDLLSYRPSAPVLPTPTVTREPYMRGHRIEIKWAAPPGMEIVATDKAEFNRIEESIFDTMEAAGIVSFLRWKRQRDGIQSVLRDMFWTNDYIEDSTRSMGFRTVTVPVPFLELTVSAFDNPSEFRKPRENEPGYRGINLYAYRRDPYSQNYVASIGPRGANRSKKRGWNIIR